MAGGLPADRVDVLPNPVDAAIRPAGEPATPARFIYFGRLVEEKGLEVLLEASRFLADGARVSIFGSGRLQAAIRSRVEGQSLPVDLRGFAAPATITAELAATTAAVLPALWPENCPMTILEAAAQGVPTIATTHGGIPELVEHGRTGILVPPAEPGALAAAMNRLSANPTLAARLGVAAWRRVLERHRPQDHVTALVERYRRIVDANARS